MNSKFLICLLLIITTFTLTTRSQQLDFDQRAFYHAMASTNIEEIDIQLKYVKASSIKEKEAYEGALLMKKAGLLTKAKDKLSFFKLGRTKLEASIKKDADNAEYCFLRLIIQENAPKAVNYRNNISQDSLSIKTNLKNLPTVVRDAISNYSKNSKAL